jgi:hypothetical protein
MHLLLPESSQLPNGSAEPALFCASGRPTWATLLRMLQYGAALLQDFDRSLLGPYSIPPGGPVIRCASAIAVVCLSRFSFNKQNPAGRMARSRGILQPSGRSLLYPKHPRASIFSKQRNHQSTRHWIEMNLVSSLFMEKIVLSCCVSNFLAGKGMPRDINSVIRVKSAKEFDIDADKS